MDEDNCQTTPKQQIRSMITVTKEVTELALVAL
jgi:hypothetical protein